MQSLKLAIRLVAVACVAGLWAAPANGEGLAHNRRLDYKGVGLRVAVGGVGLHAAPDPEGARDGTALGGTGARDGRVEAGPRRGAGAGADPLEGDLAIDIGGAVHKAILYWAGVGPAHAQSTMIFDGVPAHGDVIGTESGPPDMLAFRADVTDAVQQAVGAQGPGAFEFHLEHATPDDAIESVYGVGLLVIYTDPDDDTLRMLRAFDGIDFAWADARHDDGRGTTPITLEFDPTEADRSADVVILCGSVTPEGADRIHLSGNAPLENTLTGADGPQWHTGVFPVTIAAGADELVVELESPAGSERADRLVWTLGGISMPMTSECTGVIGDRVWVDTNGNGCQDDQEEGAADAVVALYRTYEDGGLEYLDEMVTGADGRYEFSGLCAGTYLLDVTLEGGETEAPPRACDLERDSDGADGIARVTLEGFDTVDRTVDFGFVPLAVSEREHPGWNWIEMQVTLTGNEPTYWSALSGLPKGVSPWTTLDPGDPPGRPDPEGTSDRVLRGFVVGWAVNGETGEEIRWNHLSGDATIIEYGEEASWQYSAYAFQAVQPGTEHGDPTGTPGQLNLNGTEYDDGYSHLALNFMAVGSSAYSENGLGSNDTDLTLHPLSMDFRQESEGPVHTKISFDIWNGNEVKFTALDRCIVGWDEALLSTYGGPNHFLLDNLHTDQGKARMRGLQSRRCPGSEDVSILGVASKVLTLDEQGTIARAGSNLIGMGHQSAAITYDRRNPPPPGPGNGDRGNSSQKGSLLVWSKVEVRWDDEGNVTQDTVLHLTNDYPGDVRVILVFVNGDPPAFAEAP